MRFRHFAFLILCTLAGPAFAGGLIDRFGVDVWRATASQPAADFGYSATTAGDVDGDGYNDILVGADFEDSTLVDEGVAYLFRGSSHGTLLTPSWFYCGRQAVALAGNAVSSAGDVNNDGYADVLVGVPLWDTQANTDVGKVVLFLGGPNGLSTTPALELFSPNPSNGEGFGSSVAPAGDINGDGHADVLVGAKHVVGGVIVGAVYLFEGGVGGLFPAPSNTFLGFPVGNSQMGHSVAGAGDINADGFSDVILGSPGDSRSFTSAGAVYVFTGKASGVMDLDTLFVGVAANQAVGNSVSGVGDVNGDGYADVVLGAPGAGGNIGRALIGYGGSKGIATFGQVPNPEALVNEFTGSVVSTVGDVNGDGYADFGVVSRYISGTSRGRISIYFGSPGGPQYFGEILTRPGTGFFGNSLATSGDTDGDGMSEILVGCEDTYNSPPAEASVFQFKAPRNGLLLATGWPKLGPEPGTFYGAAVAAVSRLTGNDFGVIVIGDPLRNGNGRISVHQGDPGTGVLLQEFQSFDALGSFQSYGTKIVDVGDTDGDSYSDYAVAKTTINNGAVNQAGQVVLHRGAQGIPGAAIPILTGSTVFDRVGSALAGRGDVNGDGYLDLVIGAREWDEPGKADAGRVWVYLGSPTGLLASPPWTQVGSVAGQGFGAGLALTDLDADGYSDVIVGSSSPTFGSTAAGRIEVFYGSASGPSNTPGLTYLSPVAEVSYGLTVAAIGDVTGDGVADLAVGSPLEIGRGVVRIYAGSLARSQGTDTFARFEGTQVGARYGEAIAGGGDVDGDGIGDMAIGEPGWDGGLTDEGRFTLYYGPALSEPLSIESNVVGATLGASIAPFRDINLDGFADVIVGAPGGAGRVYPFLGGGSLGKRLEYQPVDYGGLSPRALHPALSHDPDQVAGTFFKHTAAQGYSKIGFQVEVKTTVEPFDGIPTNQTSANTIASPPPGSEASTFMTSFLGQEFPGRTFKVRSRWITPNPLFPRSRWVTPEAHTSGDHDAWITGASVGVPAPSSGRLAIETVAPNPSSGPTASVVTFTLPARGEVSLDVYDLRGARVRRLLSGVQPAGPAAVAWDGRSDDRRIVPAGVYMTVLRSGNAVERAKVVRLP